MNNKIVTFGSTGFIGSRFCEMYNESVYRVNKFTYDVECPGEILYLISTIDNYNIHDNLHVDVDTNLKVLMSVLENFKKRYDPESAPTFNFVSSWFVYGKNDQIPFNEDNIQCNPTGFYSITKRCAEQMLICFCNTFGYKYRIFRLANVLGEGDKKISRKKNALQFMIKEIVNNRDVELYHGGEVLRDYIYIDDVCSGIKLCIEKSDTNQIYNIGSGNPYKFVDLINKTIEYSNSNSKIISIKPSNFHNIVQVRNSYLDINKIKKLGFKTKYDINTTITKLVDFYNKQK